MACDDGQEEHLASLAAAFDARVRDLKQSFGEIGDMRLAVMAAITVADEASELRRRLAEAKQRWRRQKPRSPAQLPRARRPRPRRRPRSRRWPNASSARSEVARRLIAGGRGAFSVRFRAAVGARPPQISGFQ